MDISEKTLKEIQEKNITPCPRWRCLFRDYFLWGSFAGSVLLSSLAVSALIFMLTAQDWDVHGYLEHNLFDFKK